MNPLTIRPDRLERLRKICLALPEATEKEAWGDPTWRVGDRIFAMQKGNYGGGRPSLWLKGALGAQQPLVESDPEQYFVPPYVGHRGWIGVYLDRPRLDWAIIGYLIEESYRLTAASPRKGARRRQAAARKQARR